jgi:hypothetical protein
MREFGKKAMHIRRVMCSVITGTGEDDLKKKTNSLKYLLEQRITTPAQAR